MKVILHVNEKNKLEKALANIHNLLNCNPNLKIELLIHDEPIKELITENAKTDNLFNTLSDISSKGVVIAACNNSLNKFDIPKDSLLPFVKIVPAGIMELIDKQHKGFAYVKP